MQIAARQCWGAEDRSGSFSGTLSMSGGTIQEQIGRVAANERRVEAVAKLRRTLR